MKCNVTQTCADQLVPFQVLHGEMPVTVGTAAYQEAAQWTVMVMHWKEVIMMAGAEIIAIPHVMRENDFPSTNSLHSCSQHTPTVVISKTCSVS